MQYFDKTHKLAEFAKTLLDKKSLESGLPHIAKYAKEVMNAERCSIFIYDQDDNMLWTTLADGVEKITIPADKGIVGHTLSAKKPIITNEPYKHPEFLGDVDEETGFKTHNIITAPIFSSKREIIGIMELLNKPEDFNSEDMRFMIFFAHYVSGFLEYLKRLDQHEKYYA